MEKNEQNKILILHGWRVPVQCYFPLKKFFEQEGFEVLVPQLPGFGEDKTLSRVYGLNDYVEFVTHFLGKKKIDQFFLIGHSFGGRVAIKLAVSYPEKVRALVLTGVPAIENKRVKKLFFLILAKLGKAFFLTPPFSLLRRRLKKILYYLVGEWDYYKAKGVMRQTFKKVVAENLSPVLPQVKVPTLLVWGGSDPVVSVSLAQKIAGKIPGARLAVIPHASHKLPYENPKIFFKKCLTFFRHLKL